MVAQFETDPQEVNRIMPIRKCYGPLDMVHYYGPTAEEVKAAREAKIVLPPAKEMKVALDLASRFGLASSVGPASGPLFIIPSPEQEYYYLTKTTTFVEPKVGRGLAAIDPGRNKAHRGQSAWTR